MTPRPPIAKKVPKVDVLHGDLRQDDYSWLRAKDDPEVTAHLQAENDYTAAVMRPTASFRDTLYQEMLARIKQDDQTVPYRRGRHVYYSRTETGKQYPILCRKALDPDAQEEVTLDLNVLAEGHPFLSVGVYAVSDDGRLLAYSLDLTGFREYTLHVKDLVTGEVLSDRIARVGSVAWSAENDVFFYVTEDDAKRP
jgi:oligopeptidase B